MSSCGFKGLVSSSCGSSKYQKQPSESIILLNCCKDIKGHLNGLNTFDSDLKSEAKLILARAGKSLKIITINMFLSEVWYKRSGEERFREEGEKRQKNRLVWEEGGKQLCDAVLCSEGEMAEKIREEGEKWH